MILKNVCDRDKLEPFVSLITFLYAIIKVCSLEVPWRQTLSGDVLGFEEGISNEIVLGADDKQGALGSSKYISGGYCPSRLLNANFCLL